MPGESYQGETLSELQSCLSEIPSECGGDPCCPGPQ